MYRIVPWVHLLLAVFSVVREKWSPEKVVQSRGDGEIDPRGNFFFESFRLLHCKGAFCSFANRLIIIRTLPNTSPTIALILRRRSSIAIISHLNH
jgi:hypothetical protein